MKSKEDKVDFILGITYTNVTKDELMEFKEFELDIIIDKIREEINKIAMDYSLVNGNNLVDNQIDM